MKLLTNIKERLFTLALRTVRQLELSSIEMMPIDIQNGDWVIYPRWIHGPVKVIDQNWALRAVAVQLGPNGGIVVWPMRADMKRTSSPPVSCRCRHPPVAEERNQMNTDWKELAGHRLLLAEPVAWEDLEEPFEICLLEVSPLGRIKIEYQSGATRWALANEYRLVEDLGK